jgi:hypothetical protein
MVSIKHKVTIKTKTEQEETPAAVESPVVTLKRKQPEVAKEPTKVAAPAPAPEPEKKSNTGKIIGGVAAAAAILAGVYFFGIKGDDKTSDDVNPPTEQVAQAGDVTQPEATSPTDASEEGTAEEKGTVSDAPETVSPTEASETPAKTGKEQSQTPAQPEEKKADKPSSVAPSATKPVQQTQSPKNNATATQIASASAPIGGDVVENAKRVIRGDFGNGQERKDKLGSAYAEIQSKVNEMYRQGLVY